MPTKSFKLIASILISLAAGAVGSLFMTSSSSPDAVWYTELIKPELSPPGWVFGPVWTLLYILMGVALWLVWTREERVVEARTSIVDLRGALGSVWLRLKERVSLYVLKRLAYLAFGVQLVLNALWSAIFFGLKSPGVALIEIVLLWLAILWTILIFRHVSRKAAWLLVPYILWVSFAGYLNYMIWVLN